MSTTIHEWVIKLVYRSLVSLIAKKMTFTSRFSGYPLQGSKGGGGGGGG